MLNKLLKLLILIVCMAFVTSLAEVAVAAAGTRPEGARASVARHEEAARGAYPARAGGARARGAP